MWLYVGWTGGAVDMRRLASLLCDSGSIPVLSVSCGLSLSFVLSLLRGFFSGSSDFPPSAKTNTSKFQFRSGRRTFKHEPLTRETGRLHRRQIKYLFISFHFISVFHNGVILLTLWRAFFIGWQHLQATAKGKSRSLCTTRGASTRTKETENVKNPSISTKDWPILIEK